MSNTVTLTASALSAILPFNTNYYTSDYFTPNSDGSITYNGTESSYLFIDVSIYFFTGTVGNKTINILRDGAVMSRSLVHFYSNYQTQTSGMFIIGANPNSTISVKITGVANDYFMNDKDASVLNIGLVGSSNNL